MWPSTRASRGPAKITVQSPITEALGEVQPQGPSPGNGARGSSDSAAPKHRRRRRSRESRVSAAGLLAPSGAASERRSGSLGFSAVHSVRCAAVLHLSENVPWAQRRHATAVARPGPLDVGRRVSVPCLCWLEVPFSPWLRAGRGAQLHTPSSLSVYGRVARVGPALCPSATSPRALLLEDARAVSSDYPGGRSSPRPADLHTAAARLEADGRRRRARVPGARAFPAGRLRRPAPLGAPSETQAASRCSEFAARPVASGEAAAPASPTVPSPAV